MRVAFIAYDMHNYHGGPIVNAERLLPELKRRGHEPIALIIYHGHEAPAAARLQQQGVECRLAKWNPYTEPKIYWILRQLQELEPDIFVPNISVAGYYAAHWARKAGIPSVAAHRSDDPYHWGMIEEFVTGEQQWAVSGVACVNNDLYRRVAAKRPQRTRLRVIPSGVPIPPETSNQEGPLRLVYAGRLVQQAKRVRDTIDAISAVLEQMPDVTATLYGEGPERDQLEVLVRRRGLSNRLDIAGPVPIDKIQEHLARHHVLVLLSDYEGTPGSVMDGMACGLVPVCLDIPGGVRDLVLHETTGLLVNDRGPSFVAAIQQLAEDQELRVSLGRNARKHIKQKFSLQVAADRWEKFIEELLQDAGPRRPIQIPERLDLPPVHPDLAREDRRTPPFLIQVLQHSYWGVRSLTRRFLNL